MEHFEEGGNKLISNQTKTTSQKSIPETLHASINTAKAIARLTYKSLYIVDYTDYSFPYVSLNPLFLCGHSSEEVMDKGFKFFKENVDEEDLRFVEETNHAAIEFIKQKPIEERINCTLSYSFYLKAQIKSKIPPLFVNHQITPMSLDENGNVKYAICVVSLAHSSKRFTAELHFEEEQEQWIYQKGSRHWKPQVKHQLLEQEKMVIALSTQGMAIQEIALTMHRSIDTVKMYRKKLFQKLDVNNISEAIAYATHHKML